MIMYFEDVERAMSVLNQAGMRGGGASADQNTDIELMVHR